MTPYDAVIVGAGHNGLVCAALLARAGRKVLVLERRAEVGGAACTETLAPGYRCSSASYVISLLLPELERELNLAAHGYRVLARSPSSFTPCEDGRSLLMGPDSALNRSEIAQFSSRDAEAFGRYEAWLTRVAEHLEPALMGTPPDLLPLPASWRRRNWRERLRHLGRGHTLYRALQGLGSELPETLELLTGPATPILERWFESEVLKGTLATDAVIGTFQPPSAPGTGYVLLHHVMGMAGGARGVWGYVEGGMGRLSEALASAARGFGAEIRCDAAVSRIEIDRGRVKGVTLSDGSFIGTRSIASNATAEVTFRRLIAPEHLPTRFVEAVARIDYASASVKINLALDRLPDFSCRPNQGAAPGPQHRGTIHIGASLAGIERAYAEARDGHAASHPVIEMTLPTSVDTTLAPAGHHIANLFVQYAPYHLSGRDWSQEREPFADRVVAEIDRLAPGFSASILHREVLAPPDLESRFGLTGGNIFQGAMPLHQLFSFRPVPGWSDYRTPVHGLYLCGAAAHPGGGVSGACGRNAAQEMLRDRR